METNSQAIQNVNNAILSSVPTSTWSCGECNSHLNPGATQVKDQPLACNNCQKIFHKRCTNRKGVKGIGWNKTPWFCPACLASNIFTVGNSTISDSLQLASPSPSSLASISQPTNSRLASTSLPQGSSSITTLSTARQNPVTSVPPDDATETVPLTRGQDDPRNTDQPQRFPSNAIRQRKSNIAVLEPEKEFQKATIDACRSTITQQEAELKRLKESLDIRNRKIMQLESQVGLATSHLSRRDECPKDSNSRTVTDQLSATLSSLNLLLSKLTLWSDPPVSRASPVNVYNTHCNHNRPYQVDRCTQTQTIMNISSTTPDASTVAVEVSDTMDATDNEDSHDDIEIIFTSTLCNKDLKSSQQLDRHVENVHNNQATQPPAPVNNLESSIECEYCGETFPTQKLLHLHISSKHATNYIPCNSCKLRFHSKAQLETHMRTSHGQIRGQTPDISTEFTKQGQNSSSSSTFSTQATHTSSNSKNL